MRTLEEKRQYQRDYWQANKDELNEKQNIYRRNKRAGRKNHKMTFQEYIIKLLKEDRQMNH